MTKDSDTSCKLGEDAPVGHRLIHLFWTLGPAFSRWAESHMDHQGLTPHRMRMLGLLVENGPMMMSSLRDELGVTATNITALVDALEKEGMVARRHHPTDRRATMIGLTSKSAKQLPVSCLKFRNKVAELFADFSHAEQEQLLKLLLRTRAALVKRDILEEGRSKSIPNRSP